MVKISLADMCQPLNSIFGVASNSTVLCKICNTCKIEVISVERIGKDHLLSTESIIYQANSTSFTGRKSLKSVSTDKSFSPVTAPFIQLSISTLKGFIKTQVPLINQ
jgi:hypothetical protein